MKLNEKKKIVKRKQLRGKSGSKIQQTFMEKAFLAGQLVAENHSIMEQENPKKLLNGYWNQWRIASNSKKWSWILYEVIAKKYVEGFCRKAGLQSVDWMLIPTVKKVAVIITVMNEEKAIFSVLGQINRLPIDEIIVVINGSTDKSFNIVRTHSSATIVHYPDPLGHDVGRAIGARLTNSDILLFLDGDFPIYAEHLVPFIDSIDQGKDVALNDISPYISMFSNRDAVTMMKEFLNRSLGRPDLGANSLTAIPHALSKKAIEFIGYQDLTVPPKALAKAIRLGLQIASPMSVDVISKNKPRGQMNEGDLNPVADMIIGDHLEALQSVMVSEGKRLFYQDVIRNRALAGVNGN